MEVEFAGKSHLHFFSSFVAMFDDRSVDTVHIYIYCQNDEFVSSQWWQGLVDSLFFVDGL